MGERDGRKPRYTNTTRILRRPNNGGHVNKDTEFEIRRIAQFLEVQDDLDLIRHITEKVSFDNMKQAKIQYVTEALEKDPTCAKREYGNSVEKRSKYYRKGKVGDWKNHFTVAQNELLTTPLRKE